MLKPVYFHGGGVLKLAKGSRKKNSSFLVDMSTKRGVGGKGLSTKEKGTLFNLFFVAVD